jgi:hypothetical protein
MQTAFNRINVFALGARQSRREITRFWQRAYVFLKTGRWYRLSPPRLAVNLLREAKLALHFMHSMLSQIKAKEPLRRPRLSFKNLYKGGSGLAKKPIAISLGLPNKVGELKATLETFFLELGVKIIPAGKSLEGLLEEGQEFLSRSAVAASINDSRGHVQQAEKAVSAYLNGLKGKADYVLLPLVQELEHYHARFIAGVEQMAQEVSSKLKRLPKIINVPLPRMNAEALRENLLQVGLLFTDDLGKIQLAYERALAQKAYSSY